MIKYALRKTNKGYQLVEVSIKQCSQGEFRKFCNSTTLFYKRLNYAEKQAHKFYKSVYPKHEREYIGIIDSISYQGEKVN